jgi:hypothetical protein
MYEVLHLGDFLSRFQIKMRDKPHATASLSPWNWHSLSIASVKVAVRFCYDMVSTSHSVGKQLNLRFALVREHYHFSNHIWKVGRLMNNEFESI